MHKIILADDHIVLRQGIKSILSQNPSFQVVGEASDGFEVLPLIEKFTPDIVILDLGMPNLGGIETISRIQKLSNKPAILVLSAKEDNVSVSDSIKAGAKAYVPKSSSGEELIAAVSAVLKGQSYISPTVAGAFIGAKQNPEGSPLGALSTREREVLKLLCEGKPNREVAKALHISPRTIDSHRSNIMKKLGAESNAELVQIAIRTGLVE